MRLRFIELVATDPTRAVWEDDKGIRRIYSAPKQFRPTCQGVLPNGKPCYRKAAGNSPLCKVCRRYANEQQAELHKKEAALQPA